MTPPLRLAAAFALLPVAASGLERPTVWDLRLGLPAAEQPAGFVELACGTNGGPPGRPLAAFAEFATCPADDRGLHEVAFRYDEEAEYVARALEQPSAIELYAGTRAYGIPVTVSALFDAEGLLQGLRLVTDARGAEPGKRNDDWTLGTLLRARFGADGWSCEELPPGPGETAVASYFVKDRCTKAADGVAFTVERQYLHRRGQVYVDEGGKVQPGQFISSTSFEMVADAGQ